MLTEDEGGLLCEEGLLYQRLERTLLDHLSWRDVGRAADDIDDDDGMSLGREIRVEMYGGEAVSDEARTGDIRGGSGGG